ncbi:hypothetical protein N7536_011421 [Penicillium majusculum]|nr:hypothetical protein N7536_011421 [Penicillium majusculum]
MSVHTSSGFENDEYQDYDERAHLPYPIASKPPALASRPRTSHRSHPPHGSPSASGRRPTSRRMAPEHQSFAPRGRRQQSPDSPDSADSADEYPPNFGRNDRKNWQQPMPPAPGYAPNQRSALSKTPYPSAPPFQVPLDFVLRAGDQAKDVTVHLDLDAAVDINPDLECLSRLNRLGHFKEASRLFEERLVIHVDFFPVVAEYADVLLEQGSFGHLHDFLSTRLKDSRVEYSDGEIQLVEACLRIITYAVAHSTFLQNKTFRILLEWNPTPPVTQTVPGVLHSHKSSRTHLQKPSSRSNNNVTFDARTSQDPVKDTTKRKYPLLSEWYRFLVREGFFWESHRILRAILPLLGDELCGQYTIDGTLEDFADLDELPKAPDMSIGQGGISRSDEQLLFTELANASLFTAFFNLHTSPKSVQAIQRQFSQRAHYLATSILSTFPHLINTRPYLDWVLLEATQGLWMGVPFQPSVTQSRHAARIWSRDSTTRTQYLQPGQTTAYSNTTIESRLNIVAHSAKEIGDHHLQQCILQYLVHGASSPERRLTVLQDLAQLCQKDMQDLPSYLQYLVDEYPSHYSYDFVDVNKKCLTLQRLFEFDNTFPSRFDYDFEARQRLNIVFFDVPSLARLRILVRYNLLKSMGRNIEADLATVRLRHTEEHVPRHMLPYMCSNFTTCSGCADCGGLTKEPSPVGGINPPTSGPSSATPPAGPAPYQTYQTNRALGHERHESHLGNDDIVRNVEKMMKED